MPQVAEFFSFENLPQLRTPILIAAFKGWNDAAEAASSAVRFLIDTWSAPLIASIDPEEFYDFSETRPRVRMLDEVQREIEWPSIDLFAYRQEELEHDVVLMVGHEPQLRWRTFVAQLSTLMERLGVSRTILLGALLADAPHTRPTRISGSTPNEELYGRMEGMGIIFSRYEGPTGIVGVLQDASNRQGIPAVSLWGSVPHYITATPNPQVSVTLLRHLDTLLDLHLNLHLLEGQARRFRARVDEAIARSPEASAYVRELEEREETDEESPPGNISPLPTGPEVVRALEEFLRQQRTDDDEE